MYAFGAPAILIMQGKGWDKHFEVQTKKADKHPKKITLPYMLRVATDTAVGNSSSAWCTETHRRKLKFCMVNRHSRKYTNLYHPNPCMFNPEKKKPDQPVPSIQPIPFAPPHFPKPRSMQSPKRCHSRGRLHQNSAAVGIAGVAVGSLASRGVRSALCGLGFGGERPNPSALLTLYRRRC